jgi:Flp pilus assembly protein TadD
MTALAVSCSLPKVVVLKDPLSAREHLDLGLSYELKGELDHARAEYLKASRLDPAWAAPYFNLGNISYREHDLAAAERLYCKALSRDRDNPDILNNLALVKHELGRHEEALSLIRRALSTGRCRECPDTLRLIEQAAPAKGADR